MSYNAPTGDKSIYANYYAEKQIVTMVNATHSPLCFAIAKISKISQFCKFFARKKMNDESAFAVI